MSDAGAGVPGYRRVLLLLLAAGALLVAAGGVRWGVAAWQDGLGRTTELDVDGAALLPVLTVAGWLLLAALLALLAGRTALRRLVGVLVAVLGVGVLVGVVGLLVGKQTPQARIIALADAGQQTVQVTVSAIGPVLASAGALAAVVAGVLTVRQSQRWPKMGSRYERGAQLGAGPPASSEAARPEELWDALDRGEDPTAS